MKNHETDLTKIQITLNSLTTLFILTDSNITFLPPIRKHIKEINKTFRTINIINSERSKITFDQNFQKLNLILNLFKNLPIPENKHESSLFNFRIKILSATLPTKSHLHITLPHIYKNANCPRCHAHEETINHIWTCPIANS